MLEALVREREPFGYGTAPWWAEVRSVLAGLDAERKRARAVLLCALITHVPRAPAE